MAWSELKERQRLMSSFIGMEPIYINLERPNMTETSAGGVVQNGYETIQNQRFYWQPLTRRLTMEKGHNPQTYGEEEVMKVDYVLIFMPDETDCKEGDQFTMAHDQLEDGDYEVVFISKRQWDRQQAGVRRR